MILDQIARLDSYSALIPHAETLLKFLTAADFAALAEGRCDIEGDNVYAMVIRGDARAAGDGQLEAHRRYIDIQILMKGRESMGWAALKDCGAALSYDADSDLQFFEDEPQAWLEMHPGQFALFFPGDAHLPMVGSGGLEKLVIKVQVD